MGAETYQLNDPMRAKINPETIQTPKKSPPVSLARTLMPQLLSLISSIRSSTGHSLSVTLAAGSLDAAEDALTAPLPGSVLERKDRLA